MYYPGRDGDAVTLGSVLFVANSNCCIVYFCCCQCIVLQAPVSDRESASLNDNYPDAHNSYIQLAQQFVVGKKGNEMMPRDAHWAPITAYRYLSLYDVNGDDDFFSSDLTDEELVEKLSHLSTYQQSGLHTLVTYSGSDEYVPSNVNKEELVERLCMAMNAKCSKGSRQVASPLLLPSGNHNLSQSPSDASTFVDAVSAHLQLAVPP